MCPHRGREARAGTIDAVLRQAVDAKEVPGVVAMATTDKGLVYEGAFGPRALEAGSAGTVSWGGLFNTYYWIDPAKRVTGFIMTQILPFADTRALKLYGQFERGVYEALKAV